MTVISWSALLISWPLWSIFYPVEQCCTLIISLLPCCSRFYNMSLSLLLSLFILLLEVPIHLLNTTYAWQIVLHHFQSQQLSVTTITLSGFYGWFILLLLRKDSLQSQYLHVESKHQRHTYSLNYIFIYENNNLLRLYFIPYLSHTPKTCTLGQMIKVRTCGC